MKFLSNGVSNLLLKWLNVLSWMVCVFGMVGFIFSMCWCLLWVSRFISSCVWCRWLVVVVRNLMMFGWNWIVFIFWFWFLIFLIFSCWLVYIVLLVIFFWLVWPKFNLFMWCSLLICFVMEKFVRFWWTWLLPIVSSVRWSRLWRVLFGLLDVRVGISIRVVFWLVGCGFMNILRVLWFVWILMILILLVEVC